MDFLVSILGVTDPGLNFIGSLIKGIYQGIGSFGWTIILFTLILKAITLPVEFWQRYSAHKNAETMKQMKPMVEKIDKAYGDNKRGAQQEKNKLYKKYGYSMVSGCLPSLITMAIFIFMMFGLSSYTSSVNAVNYINLQQTYYESVYTGFRNDFAAKYNVSSDKEVFTDEDINEFIRNDSFENSDYDALIAGAQKAVGEYANENRESFLWIKNIWRPDTWVKVMPDYSEFSKGSLGMGAIKGADEIEYTIIYNGVIENADAYGAAGWNGLLMLPLLALVAQFFSMRISMRAQSGLSGKDLKNSSDPAMQSQKMMQWMMPVMMVAFTLFYTAAFAIYITSNALLSIAANLAMTPLVKRIRKNKKVKIVNEASYRR